MTSNVSVKENETEFVITIKKNVPMVLSKSGKSYLVGTTSGFMALNNGYTLGLNLCKSK
jgi:hypothetical protein